MGAYALTTCSRLAVRLPFLLLTVILAFPVPTLAVNWHSNAKATCITPHGIDGKEAVLRSSALEGRLPADGIVSVITKLSIEELREAETPVRFHLIAAAGLPVYSCMAAFEPHALEHFARVQVSQRRRRCAPKTPAEKKQFNLHRRVSLAYCYYFAVRTLVPPARKRLDPLMRSWGLDPNICKKHSCRGVDTPWGLANALRRETKLLLQNDGWNAHGTLSRKFNRIPYEDWRPTPYRPVNSPYKLTHETRWQPLLDHNKMGSLYYQEHTVSHIGLAAKSYFLGDKRICSLKAPNPHYNYNKAIPHLLKRTASLNKKKKAAIRVYDTKYQSLFPLQFQYFARKNISQDSFEFMQVDAAVVSAIYESTIVVWKEKVRHDRVRPTSIIRKRLAGKRFLSYAGSGEGNRQVRAEEWTPFIRTMPHSEYPSGSACVCRAFVRVMQKFAGSDNIEKILGVPLILTLPKEYGHLAKGVLFKYSKFSDISHDCSQSRLDGGMHFADAVYAGEKLCDPIGGEVADAFIALGKGQRPKYVSRLHDAPKIRPSNC